MSATGAYLVNRAQIETDIATEWVSALNELDLSRLQPYCRRDLIVHAPTPADSLVEGLDKIALLVACYRTAFPDGRFALQSTYRDGELVCCRWTARGVNSGPFLDFPATNRDVVVRGTCRFRTVEGLVAEHWFDVSLYDIIEQLGGLLPEPGHVVPSAEAINREALAAWIDALSGGARAFEAVFNPDLVVHSQCFDLRFVERGRESLEKVLGYVQVMVSDIRVSIRDEVSQGRTSTYRGLLGGRFANAADPSVSAFYCMCRSESDRVVEFWVRIGGRPYGMD
jgi:predicted ester cyclase